MKRMMLYSCDCHAGLVTDEYPEYFDSAYQAALGDYLAERRRQNRNQSKPSQTPDKQSEATRRGYDDRVVFSTQIEKRIPAMDQDGFVGEIIFPDGGGGINNTIPFTGLFGSVGTYEFELYAAGLRAYNRWLGECHVPVRQIGLALVPLRDGAYAAEQVRAARGLGLEGIAPQWDGMDPSYSPIYDGEFDQVWAACVDEDLPVNFHTGAGIPQRFYAPYRATAHGSCVAQVENQFWGRRALWNLIFGGVLERFPGLKVGMVELTADWLPRTIEYLDWYWETKRGNSAEQVCPRPPSEYWRRQCFTGASPMSYLEVTTAGEKFPAGTFAYGTDFPHPTSPWGTCREYLQATIGRAGVGEAEARGILGENIARIYGLDLAQLQKIADEIGPLPEEVLSPPGGGDGAAGLAPYIALKANRPLAML